MGHIKKRIGTGGKVYPSSVPTQAYKRGISAKCDYNYLYFSSIM